MFAQPKPQAIMSPYSESNLRLWIAGAVCFVVAFVATSVIYYFILGDPQPVIALIVAVATTIGLSIANARHRKRANGESGS